MTPAINAMKDAIVRLYDESNRLNLDVFDELLAPDFVSYGGAGFQDLNGPGEFKDLYKTFHLSMPDLHFRVEQMVAEGNEVGVRGTLSGTHLGNFMGMAPATGRRITWTGTAIFGFDEAGLSNARWQEWDGLSVMQQMGVIPTPPGMSFPLPPGPNPPYIREGSGTSPSQNKQAVLSFLDEFWCKGNTAAADVICHAEAVTHPASPEAPHLRENVRRVHEMLTTGMPDLQLTVKKALADGDYVLVWHDFSGTQTGPLMDMPATGKRATWGQMTINRFAGGHIVESWINTDVLGCMQQLGAGGGGGKG